MLALRLLLRNARGGEVKLLAFALILAVAVVSGIAIFADRLDRTLVQESNAFLGADLMVSGTQPHRDEWRAEAERRGLRQTQLVQFSRSEERRVGKGGRASEGNKGEEEKGGG